jgi:hypothetical protein
MRIWRQSILSLAAWLVPTAAALAQPPDLVRFILQPESVVEFSVRGTASDTTTSVSGTKEETHAEGYSVLAGWAPPVLALAASAQSNSTEIDSPGLEYRIQEEFQGVLAGLRLGPLGLFGGAARQSIDEASETVDVKATFKIEIATHSLYGVTLDLAALGLAYVRSEQDLELNLNVSGFDLVKEVYPVETTSVAALLDIGGEQGFHLNFYYLLAETSRADGVVVDFDGSIEKTRSASVGWRGSGKQSNQNGFSLFVSQTESRSGFENFLARTQDELAYGFEIGFSSGISLSASLKNTNTETRYDSGYVVESESQVVEAGLGYRF